MTRPAVDFSLYLITDRNGTRGRSLPSVVEEALKGGANAIQLREKDLSSRDLYEAADMLRQLTARYGARLFINDRIDIALAVGADGVHLGTAGIPLRQARELLDRKRLIGVSCHDIVSAVDAERDGADFITFGPVFPTPSKAVYGSPVGTEKLSEAAGVLGIPVFALGGVNLGNVARVLAAGAYGIALISAVMAADDPLHETKSLLSSLSARKD